MTDSLNDLVVEFAGQRFEVVDRLTFGRSGDVELDTNRHLHRLVGEFVRRDSVWWLTNLGTGADRVGLEGSGSAGAG